MARARPFSEIKELLVVFKKGLSEERIEELVKLLGTRVKKTLSIGRAKYHVLEIADGGNVFSAIVACAKYPEIEKAEPNVRLKHHGAFKRDDK